MFLLFCVFVPVTLAFFPTCRTRGYCDPRLHCHAFPLGSNDLQAGYCCGIAQPHACKQGDREPLRQTVIHRGFNLCGGAFGARNPWREAHVKAFMSRHSCLADHIPRSYSQGVHVKELVSSNSYLRFIPANSCQGLPVKGLMSRSSSQGA